MTCPEDAFTVSPLTANELLLENSEVIKIQGPDKKGHPILRIVGKYFPANILKGESAEVALKAVHPVEVSPMTDAAENPQGVRMKDFPGIPGTLGGLLLRITQFVFAVAALSVMASTSDFPSVTAFCYLVVAVILQSIWSLSLAIVDIYALLVKRCLRNSRVVSLFTIGDGITSTLTFSAACASAGITLLMGNNLNICVEDHCASFETATTMALISWFAVFPSFLLNLWSLASR